MKSIQIISIKNRIDWMPKIQQRYIDTFNQLELKKKPSAFKNRLIKIKNKFVNWFNKLSKWQKITLILTALAAIGLLSWWLYLINTAGAAISAGEGIRGAGTIYAITDGNATKIGLTARDVAVRAAEISRYAPDSYVFGTIQVPNMLHFENLAHNHFAPLKYDDYLGSREWFDVGPRKALNYLNKMVA